MIVAIQNVPEGTSVAIPMEVAGFSRARQFWAAVGTSAPQPVGAIAAYLAVEEVTALLPFSFAFAAGAMLSLIAVEMLPPGIRAAPPARAQPRPPARRRGDAWPGPSAWRINQVASLVQVV